MLFQASGTEKKVVVVSVSPQSRASLAARYDLSSTDAGRRLTAFFKGLGKYKIYMSYLYIFIYIIIYYYAVLIVAGVHHVFDTNFSRTFSLLESQREFVERFQRKEHDKNCLPMMTSACPGIVTVLLCKAG